MALPPSARSLLQSDRPAHLVTLDRDGSPQLTLAWVGLDGDTVVIGTLFDQRKLRNIRRDPRVSISVEAGTRNPMGLDEYLVISGRAEVTEGGAPALLADLARTYLGPDAVFPPMPNPPEGFIVGITPEKVGGVGPWRDEV
jgi:PPOX class probable F420-dependent enzyme